MSASLKSPVTWLTNASVIERLNAFLAFNNIYRLTRFESNNFWANIHNLIELRTCSVIKFRFTQYFMQVAAHTEHHSQLHTSARYNRQMLNDAIRVTWLTAANHHFLCIDHTNLCIISISTFWIWNVQYYSTRRFMFELWWLIIK